MGEVVRTHTLALSVVRHFGPRPVQFYRMACPLLALLQPASVCFANTQVIGYVGLEGIISAYLQESARAREALLQSPAPFDYGFTCGV